MTDNQYSDKKIVYMGTPDFAVPALEMLCGAGYHVCAVVTQPDKPKGRGKSFMPTPVKEHAIRQGIPVFQPAKVREEEFVRTLEALSPDVIIVAAFGQIIPESILDLPPFGCINIHGSLLPKYRGAAPIQHALIDGETITGVTIMQMDKGLDTGDMLSKTEVPILPDDTGGSLFDKLAYAGGMLLLQTLPAIFEGTVTPEKQPEKSPTPYASRIEKSMGDLDFSMDAAALSRLVRGLSPWPGAYTHVGDKTLKLWKSISCEEHAEDTLPGTVLSAGPEGILVQCGAGSILFTEVQLEGKKRMDTASFLRGFPLSPGAVLERR